MRPLSALLPVLLIVAALAGCSSSSGDADTTDAAVPETTPDATEDAPADVPADRALLDAPDAAPPDATAEVSPFPLAELTDPVPLRFGLAGSLLAIPLGIPICGFMPPNKPQSPYSDQFPGSSTVYMHPTVRVLVLEGGTSRLLLVRMDLIGVNTSIVARVTHELSELTGYDWTGKVILTATHTHSSAGRLSPGFIWQTLADSFFPELYERLVAQIVGLAADALVTMTPGEMGYAVVETDALHDDRRCENPDVIDNRLHMLRFDAEGKPRALVLVHSLHGTVLGVDEQHLSRDVIGGLEEKVRESFESPVQVMLFQAGAGDVAPGDAEYSKDGDLPAIPSGYSRIEAVGREAAKIVQEAMPGMKTSADIAIQSLSHYVPLSLEAIGYKDDEFPFPGGGAYCGMQVDSECWSGEPKPIPGLNKSCLDITLSGESAPDRTLISAARIGDILLTTVPGEPVTQIMLNVEDGIRKAFPDQENIIVIGYAQDYTGYSTPEWDWWQGGYEASGAIWGPKQGDYLTGASVAVATELMDPAKTPPFTDPGPFPLLAPEVGPFVPTRSKDAGKVITSPAASLAQGETAVFEFTGGDPWHLLPLVVLEQKSGDAFSPVLRHNGTPVDSTGYEFVATLKPEPAYDAVEGAAIRKFTWRFEMPTSRRVETTAFPLEGTYRLTATGEYLDSSSGELKQYSVSSDPFDVK